MLTNDERKIINESFKKILLKVTVKSNKIRNKLSLKEHIKLYKYIRNMGYSESVEIITELGVREFESKFSSFIKYGLAGIAGGIIGIKFKKIGKIIGLTLGLATMYIFRKTTDPCWQGCFKLERDKRTICKYLCFIKGCDSVIGDIFKQKNGCKDTKNPERCMRGLDKALEKWETKKEKYKDSLDEARDRYIDKQVKEKEKEREREIKIRNKMAREKEKTTKRVKKL